jgi:predicted transport protein
MTFQAYLDNIKEKTGLGPEDFMRIAAEKGLTKHADLLNWLKTDYGLGHGHANAIINVIKSANSPKVTRDEKVDQHFSGGKAAWRETYDSLLDTLHTFGDDVRADPTNTYISLLRKDRKFAIVQVTAKRMDVGIKLPGADSVGRFEEAGAWNAMVTHRVKIDDPKQVDAELIGWLRQAYDQA